MHLNNKRLTIIVVVLIYAFSACSTDAIEDPTEPKSPQTLANLDGVFTKTITLTEEGLLFGTETGIYKKTEDGYLEYGMQEKRIQDIADLGDGKYMAVTRPLNDTTYTILYKGNNEGWVPFMGNYGEGSEYYNWVNDLAVDARIPGKMIAILGNSIILTRDEGVNWKSVHLGWDGTGEGRFVYISKHDTNSVWAGGTTPTVSPRLLRSKDGGETWEYVTSLEEQEGFSNGYCYDLVQNSANAGEVMVGMFGNIPELNGIKRSLDDGATWEQVFSGAPILTFTQSVRDPNTIYASGRNQEGELFFMYTTNFGDSWQTVNIDTDSIGITVTDLVSVLEEEKEVLYFATNIGVYTYKVEG